MPLTIDELRRRGEVAVTCYCPTCDAVLEFVPCPVCRGCGLSARFVYTETALDVLMGEVEAGQCCVCEMCQGGEGTWVCPEHGVIEGFDGF